MDRYSAYDPYLTTCFFGSSAVNIIMYIILLILVIIAVWVEVNDNNCPAGIFSNNCQMSVSNGVFTHGTSAKGSDSCDVIIEKTERAAASQVNSVKWRVAFILGVIIAVLLWIFIFQSLPHWPLLYLTVLIAFLIIYFYFNFAGFHIANSVLEIVNGNLKILKDKCKC